MATASSTSTVPKPVVPTPVATTQPREGEPILIQMKGITSKVEFIDFATRFMDKSSPVKQMEDWDKAVKFLEIVQWGSSRKYDEVEGRRGYEVAIEWQKIAIKTGELIEEFFPSKEGVSLENDPLFPIKMQTAMKQMDLIQIEQEMASLQS